MPSPDQILAGLTAIARANPAVAIAWHVVIAIALVALARGWRPPQRLARVLIALPLASVSAFAFSSGNPFNGAVLAAGAVALIALAVTDDDRAATRGSAVAWWIGVAMIAFGWVYPHFLAGSPVAYLYAAPVGLVPCPTLAIAIGFALLGAAPGRRAWTVTLAALGLFYGIFGALRLGVQLDLVLVAGAIALAASVRRVDVRASRAPRGAAAARAA
jgi:hypothetical protein